MNSDRIKEIQEVTAYPQSPSVKEALYKVWNETEQSLRKELEKMVHGDCGYCQTERTKCKKCKWAIKESKHRRDYWTIKEM